MLVLLLFGCFPYREIQNIIFPAQCENACWMGIEPNVSTADEAVEILEKTYGSENISRDVSAGVITWTTSSATWHNNGIVFYQNNLVDRILVWSSNDSVEVKDIMAEIGNPDSVGLVISNPESKCAGGSLLYSETGLEVHLYPVDRSVGVIETQTVNAFDIYAPWTSGSYPRTDTAVIPWDGYHEYCPEKWSWEK